MKPIFYSIPLFIAGVFLTACDSQSSTTNTASTQETKPAKTTSLLEVEEYISPLSDDAPTYSVAMVQYPPFKTRNEFGNVIGFDVDLVRAIGEEAGFKVQIEEAEFKGFFDNIQNAKYDFAMSGLTLTPERKKLMAFSDPYATNKVGYIVKADSALNTPAEMLDKNVAVLAGSSLEDNLKVAGVTNISGYSTFYLTIEALLAGNVDATLGEQPSIFYESQLFPEYPVKFIPLDPNTIEKYVAYAPKANQKIMEEVNQGLEAIKTNGKYNEISKKWFGDNAQEISVNK